MRTTRRLILATMTATIAALFASTSEAQVTVHRRTLPPAEKTAQPAFAPVHDSLRLYYVGRPVGWERYDFTSDASGLQLVADFDYIDRGRRNRIQSTMLLDAKYAPRKLDVARVADTSRTTVTKVDVSGKTATVLRNGKSSDVAMPAVAFAISPYQPLSQHLALLRYWMSHGSPASLAIVPGGPVNNIAIARAGVDTLGTGAGAILLTRYVINGVVWGNEYLWLDASGRMAMFASAAGGLSMKGVQADLVPLYAELMAIASRAAVNDMVAIAARTRPTAQGSVALIGATLIDGTGSGAIPNATVVVNNGKIVAAGPSASVTVPTGARRVSVVGKTIVPGLWDSHAHLHQLEWTSVYLAAGVTTVRDMGNELPFITDLRQAIQSGRAAGPNIIAAGLVDGPGPNAFGALSASTPDEGREIVRRYHDLGFEQMKLYSLLSPAVVGAITSEAHKLGMTVTGHIPTSLTLQAAIDSGMDQVAHQPIRGEGDSLKVLIEFLKKHNTVIDPTASWNEIGGHSQAEPLQNFQPVTQHLPPVFMQTRAAGWGAAVDSATAHARLARSLMTTKALHDAGIPVVVGTDEGVPAYSVYREMELYVQAGFTPMDALRAATSVPAKAMGREKDLGTIEAGKMADLLVLDANPLEKISNIRTVRFVMKGGALFDSAALWKAAGFVP